MGARGADLMWSLAQLRSALGGDIAGGGVVCPGPGHSHKDRSLSVRPSATAESGFVVFSHSPRDDMGTCRDHVRRLLGLEEWQPSGDSAEAIVHRMQARARSAKAERDEAARKERLARLAAKIWTDAVDPQGTLVETYLASRSLEIPNKVSGTALRFHPRCPWGREYLPAMIAAMRDMGSGDLKAVHRTALSPLGEKIDRRMLGPVAETAIMLTEATDRLVVGEGIESSLSALQLGYGSGVWAMGSAGAIARLPVLNQVKHLVLLEERDSASANAVSDCGHRWTRAGRHVSVVLPTIGKDLNDSLRGIP